jgi:trk system potassium uptake protein TrkA
MRQIAVIGLGKFGSTVAREASAQGAEVIALDRRRDVIEAIKEGVTHAAALDSTDENALRGVGVQNVDIAAVCIGDDVEANLLTTILLRKMGVKKIWSRAISPLQQEILRALNVDMIMNLEEDMGRAIARSLVSPGVARHIPLGPGYSIAEVQVPASLVGKTIGDLDARRSYGVNIVAIKKRVPEITDTGERTFGETVENIPTAETVLAEGDTLVVTGRDADAQRFSQIG